MMNIEYRTQKDLPFRSIIYDLAVLPEFQNKGIGSELVRRCRGVCESSEWLVQTDSAKGFYEKIGFRENDDFFYDNPHIAEVSGFMTVLNNKPIGFVSWNPTNIPIVEIGHNCISDKYKRNGYGIRQMQECELTMNIWSRRHHNEAYHNRY